MLLSHTISEILGPQLCNVQKSGITMLEHIIWLTLSLVSLLQKTRYVCTYDYYINLNIF